VTAALHAAHRPQAYAHLHVGVYLLDALILHLLSMPVARFAPRFPRAPAHSRAISDFDAATGRG
jgi:hypothetical protein